MMQVDHRFEEDLTPERIDAIIERLREEPAPHAAEPKPEGATAPAVTPAPVKPEKARPAARPRTKKVQN